MAEDINKLADKYQATLSVYKRDKGAANDAENKYVESSLKTRQIRREARDAKESETTLRKEKASSKAKYWELTDMEHKYAALNEKEKVVFQLQSVRRAKMHKQAQDEQSEVDANVKKEAELTSKRDVAQAAAILFKKNFKDSGCGGVDELPAGAPSKAEQKLAAQKNRRTANPLDAATKPSTTAVLYHKFYRKFLKQYTTQAQSKSKTLGEQGYTDCQYYTKLVSMYSDMGTTHLKYTNWMKSNKPTDKKFKAMLKGEVEGAVNDARAKYFKRLMEHACDKEEESKKTADVALHSAFIQLSATGTAQDSEDKEEYCNKQKETATASLEAAQTAKLALEKQATYVKTMKVDLAKSTQARNDAETQRDAAKSKEARYKKIATQAGKDRMSPCKI